MNLNILTTTVNQYALKLISTSNFLKNTIDGHISKSQLSTYIKNLEYHFSQNSNDLYQASHIYQNSELGFFFDHKWKEERGHDKWAQNDLNQLDHDYTPIVLPEMISLSNFVNDTMKSNPINYIAFMLFAEYATAKVGPQIFNGINISLGIKKSEFTALTNHIELDGDHANEICDFLSEIKISNQQIESMINFYSNLYQYYLSFFNALERITTPISHHEKTSSSIFK